MRDHYHFLNHLHFYSSRAIINHLQYSKPLLYPSPPNRSSPPTLYPISTDNTFFSLLLLRGYNSFSFFSLHKLLSRCRGLHSAFKLVNFWFSSLFFFFLFLIKRALFSPFFVVPEFQGKKSLLDLLQTFSTPFLQERG